MSATPERAAPPLARIGNAVLLEGYLDAVEAGRVYGWVRNPDVSTERCEVTVRLGDIELGTVTADRERPDLAKAGIGDGRYAFQYTFDEPLDDTQRAAVTAEAISQDGSSRMALQRFDRSAPEPAGGESLDWLKPALGKMAAHQGRSFAKQGDAIDGVVVMLEALERRLKTRQRIAGGGDGEDPSEIEARLGALEGMHLRFDQALLALRKEREAGPLTSRGSLWRSLFVLAVAVAAFAAGTLIQLHFGIAG